MDMMNIMYELANTKTALELAEKTIRKQKGKLLRRNILIAGLAWFGFTACKMLGESDEKLKEAETKARECNGERLKAETALWESRHKGEVEKDTCGDGCASVTKKPE